MRRLIQFVAISSVALTLPATLMAEQVPWMTDLDEAFQVAKQENRPLLLHFWSPDCIPCLQLEETVFNKPSVSRTVGELFVPVKINAKEHPRVAAQYQIRSVPWDVILAPGGNELHRMLSPQDPNRYVAQLSAAAFRMGTALNRRAPTEPAATAVAPDGRGPHSAASYRSPLGPPPGGSPWHAPQSSTLADDGVGPIGSESRPQRDSRPSEPVGEPEEVINRFAQRNTASNERSAPRAVAERQQHVAGGQWETWPGNASAPPKRDAVVSPQTTQADRAIDDNRLAAGNVPVKPPRGSRPARPARRTPAPMGLDGFCPVTLLQKDIWKKGDPRFGIVHRGRTYIFAGAAEKEEFFKNPDGFSPVLAGIDPVLLADSGEAVEGLRAFGIVYRKRVFLFTSEENLQRFWQKPEQYAGPVRQAMENGTVDRLFR